MLLQALPTAAATALSKRGLESRMLTEHSSAPRSHPPLPSEKSQTHHNSAECGRKVAHNPHRFRTPCCAPTVRFNSRPRAAPLTQRAWSHPSHESCGMVSLARRIRARHPTRMRIYIRRSSYGMQHLISQSINQSARTKQQQLASRSGNKRVRSNPCHQRNQARFPLDCLRTRTVRLNLDLALPH